MQPVVPPGLIDEMSRMADSYFSDTNQLPRLFLQTTVMEAIAASDEQYGVDAAVAWARGYTFPKAMLLSDMKCFQAAQLDFVVMVRRRLKILSSDRLSSARVDRLRSDNPERGLLYDLAVGMRVPIPVGFEPNGALPLAPLRSTYLKVDSAVNKMLGGIVEQKLAFLLPKDIAIRCIPNLHLGAAHWTPKKGKPSGRPIGDLTYVTGTPLNTEATTAIAAELYGAIKHPTIAEIVRMMMSFWEKALESNSAVQWSHLRLWKMDLRGAYTLLSFRPEDAGLFGMEVTGDLVYLQIAGIFGWACTPAAFQTVTRAIKWELSHILKSSVEMYVDDIIGICFEEDIAEDIVRAKKVCTDLLGSSAVAEDKTEWGRRLDIIGFTVDLDLMRVTISRKNFLNTLFGFMSVDVEEPISLRGAQRLASWGSRYGSICRAMRPFSGALHRMAAGRTARMSTFPVNDQAKLAIRLWRTMLVLVRFDEERYSRPMQSFVTGMPEYIVEFDASLNGVGILWYRRINGAEVCLGGSAVSLRTLGFEDDSSYQNLCEFIGATLGMIGLGKLGVRGVDVAMRGDSVSALTWVSTERYRGSNVSNASMVFTMLCITQELVVKESTHISGSDNGKCDALSRLWESGKSVNEVMKSIGLEGSRDVDLQGCKYVKRLLASCDPSILFNTESDFIRFWGDIRDALEGAMSMV